ncbi:MAG: CoA transferase [Magnetovibrio sp.]|nr:CoA transferase [Magnetovibrio sp.]
MSATPDRPLAGIRVVGLEQYMAGPYCTMLLADAGAEVIKIERPGPGDPRRSMPPFAEKDGHRKAAGFMAYNRNKKSLALNLRDPKGHEVFKRLVGTADVVVENLRPGSMAKQGLGFDDMRQLNPRLIWSVISGFGQLEGYRGPYSDRPAFDIVAEAMGGIMHMVGFADKPPSWTIYGMADIYSGQIAAYGVMQALFMRERTGTGQLVDSSMFDNMIALNEAQMALYSVAGQVNSRGRPKNAWPRDAYECADGWVAINVPDNIIWGRLAETIGHPELKDDERAKDGTARCQNIAFLQPLLADWFKAQARDAAVGALNAAGVPCGPVYDAEDIFNDPQVQARGALVEIDDPAVGPIKFARSAPHLSAAPEIPKVAAPELGQHSREVLSEMLDYSDAEVAELAEAGVVELAGEA